MMNHGCFFTLDVSHALAKSDEEPLRYIELCHDRLCECAPQPASKAKALHFPLDRKPLMATVMHALKDSGYDRYR